MSALSDAAGLVVEAISGWQTGRDGRLVVAVDGHGAAGKTTLADQVAVQLGAVVLHTDDHFRDLGPQSGPVTMARYYDWERMRREAIMPALRAGASTPLLIEGVGAAGPALADLITHAVLVQTPEPVRLQRLHARISDEEWDEEWLAEERAYFSARRDESFDLVVLGGD